MPKSAEAPTLSVDVYGVQGHGRARALLRELLLIPFLPSVIFAVDSRCRYFAATEHSTDRFVYLHISDLRSNKISWSFFHTYFSTRLKRDALKALKGHVTGNMTRPLTVEYGRLKMK